MAGLFISKRSPKKKALLYMCLGGVPKYLEQINPRYSVEQNLVRAQFMKEYVPVRIGRTSRSFNVLK